MQYTYILYRYIQRVKRYKTKITNKHVFQMYKTQKTRQLCEKDPDPGCCRKINFFLLIPSGKNNLTTLAWVLFIQPEREYQFLIK